MLYKAFPAFKFIPAEFLWNRWFSLAAAAIIGLPATVIWIRGMIDAGPENIAVKNRRAAARGIYQKIRHPQALGKMALPLVAALILNSPFLVIFSLLWIPAFYLLCRIEEKGLELQLGEEYRQYKGATGFFVPRKAIIHHALPENCLNCGAKLHGKYCHDCGQKNTDINVPFKELLHEFLWDELRIDSRFIHTLVPLVIKPGFLTADYVAGRRVRYVPPLRTYVIISFVLFLLLAMTSKRSHLEELHEEPETRTEIKAVESASEAYYRAGPPHRRGRYLKLRLSLHQIGRGGLPPRDQESRTIRGNAYRAVRPGHVPADASIRLAAENALYPFWPILYAAPDILHPFPRLRFSDHPGHYRHPFFPYPGAQPVAESADHDYSIIPLPKHEKVLSAGLLAHLYQA